MRRRHPIRWKRFAVVILPLYALGVAALTALSGVEQAIPWWMSFIASVLLLTALLLVLEVPILRNWYRPAPPVSRDTEDWP